MLNSISTMLPHTKKAKRKITFTRYTIVKHWFDLIQGLQNRYSVYITRVGFLNIPQNKVY
jgi:hypothetical protein